MADQLGTEKQLRKVFDAFEKNILNAWALPEAQIRVNLFKLAVEHGVVLELQQALYHFDKLPKRRKTEQETRQGILATAVRMGIPKEDVIAVFNKYDNLLKSATTEEQRQQISYMGAAELHKLLGVKSELVIDGKLIIPAQPDYIEENTSKFRIIN